MGILSYLPLIFFFIPLTLNIISQRFLRACKNFFYKHSLYFPQKAKAIFLSKKSFFQAKICTNALHSSKYLSYPMMGAFQDYCLCHLFLRKWWRLQSSRLYRQMGWRHQYFLLTYSPPKLKNHICQLWKPDGELKCDGARCLIPFQMFNGLPLVDKRLEN